MSDSLNDAFDEVQRLHETNALHRKGFRIAELSPREIAEHVREEATELQASPTDLEEMADVLATTFHAAVASGYTASNLRAATLRKMQERFPESYEGEQAVENSPNRERMMEFFAFSPVLIGIIAIVGIFWLSWGRPDHNLVVTNATTATVNQSQRCGYPAQATYHGAKSTLAVVAKEYAKQADRALSCAKITTDKEFKAEYLLSAADSLGTESALETNFDRKKAYDTSHRARALANDTISTTKNPNTRGEAREILKQLEEGPAPKK